jgi:hypothetical protein
MRHLLSFPHVRFLAVVLAALVGAPALATGFYQDDYIHLGIVEHVGGDMGSPFSLYRFSDGNTNHVHDAVARGFFLPWWSSPNLQLAFFRPLGCVLFVLDHALFDRAAVYYHLHALVWYLVLVVAAGALLRRTLAGPIGGLALILFAIDDAHWMPVGWIASRHALVGATAGFFGAAAHVRWREHGWKPGRVVTIAAFGLGLAASEVALGALAYIVAYEIAGRIEPFRQRLRALREIALMAVAYLALHRLLGYGAFGSGVYASPLGDPLAFLHSGANAASPLLGELVLGVPADLTLLIPRARLVWQGTGILAVALFVVLFRKAQQGLDDKTARTTRWLVLGGALSLVPSLGGFTSGRLLLVPSLGGAVGVATILLMVARSGRGSASLVVSRSLRAARALLFFVHLILAPLVFVGSLIVFRGLSQASTHIAEAVKAAPGVTPDTEIIVVASDPLASFYPPTMLALAPYRRTAPWRVLSAAPLDHRITRTALDTIEVAALRDTMQASAFERLFRAETLRFNPGDEVSLGTSTIRVAAVTDGHPTAIRMRFARPLEDASLRFMAWQKGGLRPLRLPEIGESVTLLWEPGPVGL